MIQMFSDLNEFQRDPLDFLMRKAEQTDAPFIKLKLGPLPIYQVLDPTLIKPIMKAAEEDIDKGRLIYKLRKIVGKSSLTISGEEHRRRRQAIHAQLGRGLSGNYVAEISSIVRTTIFSLLIEEKFDAHNVTARLALKTIASVLFGHGALSDADEAALIRAVHLVEDDLASGMFSILPQSPRKWLQQRQNLRHAKDIMKMVVNRTRLRASQSSLLKTLLDLGLSDEDLHDELLMILLAGHHTTGSAAAWMLYHIANDPALAQALAEEGEALLDDDGEVDAGKLSKASLTNAVIKEVLRLYPSAWWFSRELKKPLEINGFKFKKGSSLFISPYQLQRNPRVYEKPHAFHIDRKVHTHSYVPFGVGPRACVGMGFALLEMQIIAIEFALSCSMQTAKTIGVPQPKPSITLVPPPLEIKISKKIMLHKKVGAA